MDSLFMCVAPLLQAVQEHGIFTSLFVLWKNSARSVIYTPPTADFAMLNEHMYVLCILTFHLCCRMNRGLHPV